MFDTYQPDIKLIQQKVAEAIDTAEGNAPKKPDTVVDRDADGTEKPARAEEPDAHR